MSAARRIGRWSAALVVGVGRGALTIIGVAVFAWCAAQSPTAGCIGAVLLVAVDTMRRRTA